MDDRRLRCFLAVVDEGSIRRAAEALGVPQPSLSQSIRALERELDVHLFHRVSGGARLTAAGEALLGPAQEVLRASDDARDAISGVAELRSGTLEIATLTTLALDPVASVIGHFSERYPGVQIQVLEADSVEGVRALVREGECEIGAAHLPMPIGQLATRPLGAQEFLLIFPPETAQPIQPGFAVHELAQTAFVVGAPGTPARVLLEETLAGVGLTPLIAVQEPAITRTVGLIHRHGLLSAAARAFLELTTERSEQSSARAPGLPPSAGRVWRSIGPDPSAFQLATVAGDSSERLRGGFGGACLPWEKTPSMRRINA